MLDVKVEINNQNKVTGKVFFVNDDTVNIYMSVEAESKENIGIFTGITVDLFSKFQLSGLNPAFDNTDYTYHSFIKLLCSYDSIC